MKNQHYILDPLWITSGVSDIDSEYFEYVLLSADKKWREKLKKRDTSSFFEILFHMLNLNNLAVQGSIFDFNMKLTWKSDRLKNIRRKLKNVYDDPGEILKVFKNSNNIFVEVILDHLELILDEFDKCKLYYTNTDIHKEKEIFIILNKNEDSLYRTWRLKFDKRFQLNWKLEKEKDIEVTELKNNVIEDIVKDINDPVLNKMKPQKNVILSISENDIDEKKSADAIAFSIIFSRMVVDHIKFHPNILFELSELLISEKVLPFTLKFWV